MMSKNSSVVKFEKKKIVPVGMKKTYGYSLSTQEDEDKLHSIIEQLDKQCTPVLVSNQFKIVMKIFNNQTKAFDFLFLEKNDFFDYYGTNEFKVNYYDEKGVEKQLNVAKSIWFEQAERKNRIVFDLDPNYQEEEKTVNIFSGYIEEKEGDVKPFYDYISSILDGATKEEVLASFQYIVDLTAWVIQNPNKSPNVLLLLKGLQGTGKTTYFETMSSIFQGYGMALSSTERLLKFNSPTITKKIVSLEECLLKSDQGIEEKMKDLITGTSRIIESKGVNYFEVENKLFLIATTNNDTPLKLDPDDRRYAVFKTKRSNFDFKAYMQWLKNGGANALLYHFRRLKITEGFHTQASIPNTIAKTDIILHSLNTIDQFILGFLRGQYNEDLNLNEEEWVKNGVSIFRNDLHDIYNQSRYKKTEIALIDTLDKYFGFSETNKNWRDNWKGVRNQKRERTYKFPSLSECRARFCSSNKIEENRLF